MHITMEIYNKIPYGEIFKVVTTKVQNMHKPMEVELTFVCLKDPQLDHAPDTWTMYCHHSDRGVAWIRRNGDKVAMKDNIQSMCPCDPDVLALYRY